MSHTSRLRALEQLVERGGCHECHDEGGGGVFIVGPGDDEGEPPDRACNLCGRMGPPEKIVRVVYHETQPAV